MMFGFKHGFYVQPMNAVYAETVAMYVVWTLLMLLLRGKARRAVACAGAVLAFALVILFTVSGRTGGGARSLSLIPFISFYRAKIQPELLRASFMNVLLFMPLGLSLPFAASERLRHPVLLSVSAGFFLSLTVETVQYAFAIGNSELDDVIMNTLGVIIGATSFLLTRQARKLFSRKKRRRR